MSKNSALMKLEAMALFANVKAQAASPRWWYFRCMRELGRPVRLDQSISPYRASLFWDYIFRGIDCQVYLEREVSQGNPGENLWKLSFSGIEGKVHALTIQDYLKPLQQEGYYIPNGNENLERQMNFSLGLYGACLMHVDVHFPIQQPPLPCVLRVMDLLEQQNSASDTPLEVTLAELDQKRALQSQADTDEDPDIMMGDWQTWK